MTNPRASGIIAQWPGSILLGGDADGEHLRANLHHDGIELVSHEMRTGSQVDTQWRSRHLVWLYWEQLEEIMRMRPVE